MTERRIRAIVLGPLGPPFGGPEVMTRTLIDGLAARDEIDFTHLDTQVSHSLAEKGGRNQFRKSLRAFVQCVKLLLLILRERPDVVYLPLTNSPSFFGFLRDAGMIAIAALMRRRVVIRLHGGYYFYAHTSGWRRTIVAKTLRNVDLAMVQGARLSNAFDGLIPPERIRVVPNGLDDAPFAMARARVVRNGSAPQILFAGLHCAPKGVHDIIAAMPRVPGAQFVFMGEWASADDRNAALRRLHEDGTESRARFAGVVTGEAKYDLFLSADVFVFPTYFVYEGHAVSTVEALAAGLPIVCTDHGALGESVRDGWNGYFVPPRDPEAVAEKLNRLISDEQLRTEMGQRSRQLYVDRFTVGRFIDEWSRALADGIRPGGA